MLLARMGHKHVLIPPSIYFSTNAYDIRSRGLLRDLGLSISGKYDMDWREVGQGGMWRMTTLSFFFAQQ
jgi:hypothetical protein